MKSTVVDNDGNVTCPNCGAKNSFTVKRSGKAKGGLGIIALPLIAVAPKRLQCNGCGAMLKRGTPEAAVERVGAGSRINAAADAVRAVKELREMGFRDEEIRELMKAATALDMDALRREVAERAMRQ